MERFDNTENTNQEIGEITQVIEQDDIEIPDDLDSLKLPDDFFEELEAMDRKITFNIFFSPDNMMAYVRAENYSKDKDADNSVPTTEIYTLLGEKKVVYGIDDNGISEYCKGKIFYKDFVVAKGVRPVNGEDGQVEYYFSTEERYQPKELDDGTVDYKDLGLIKNVDAGAVLCQVIPPTEGTAGINIFGEQIPAKSGNWPQLKAGKNVSISEDQLQYIAITNGMVQKNKDTIEVKDIYTVNGDVGPATGNIRFNGTVNITGSVLSNFSVFANGDIIVNGFVEGSFLNAAGNIVIHKGINGVDGNGLRKGFIKADGNVTVKFAEMAKIVAGGFVYCDYCMNCDVRAGDSIIGKGNRAALLGGTYIAGKVIEANTIGSDMNIPMDVQIIPFWQELKNLEVNPVERIKQNNAALSELDKGMSKLRKLVEMLETEITANSKRRNMDSPSDIEAKKEKLKKLILQHESVKQELINIKNEKEKLERQNNCEGCMVIGKKVTHTSTRIIIGSAMLRLNSDVEVQTFIENNRMIEAHNIVPSR